MLLNGLIAKCSHIEVQLRYTGFAGLAVFVSGQADENVSESLGGMISDIGGKLSGEFKW